MGVEPCEGAFQLRQPAHSSPQQFACQIARTIHILPLEPSQEAQEGNGCSKAIQEGHRESSTHTNLEAYAQRAGGHPSRGVQRLLAKSP